MIIRKTPRELEIMREAGRIAAMTHRELQKWIQPGVTTQELNQIADRFIRKMEAEPSFKGYNGFSGSICTSVNEEVVHGIPGKRELQDGDIISIDIGAKYNGYHGDSAWTYPVGKISDEASKLLKITEESLYEGLEQIKPDVRLTNISHAIENYVNEYGFSVVRDLVGHGVGQDLHEDPEVPHFGPPNKGPRLKRGMVLAVEPMVNAGTHYVQVLEDDWTVVTQDRRPAAHFEHTVAVTEEGYEVLTRL